jgi:hypothetical protein
MKQATGALALALALTACGGGGGEPRAQQTTAPPAQQTPSTPPTPEVTPEAQALRDAVTKSLAECPCELSVEVSAIDGPRSLESVTYAGYYDPESGGASLKDADTPVLQLVSAQGRQYFTSPEIKKERNYVLLDFSGVPESKKQTYWTMLAPLDPVLTLALAQSVSEVTSEHKAGKRITYDVEFDLATAGPLTGANGLLFGRLVTASNSIGQVVLQDGLLTEVKYDAVGPGNDVQAGQSVHLVIRKRGVAAKDVSVPRYSGTLDVTQMAG